MAMTKAGLTAVGALDRVVLDCRLPAGEYAVFHGLDESLRGLDLEEAVRVHLVGRAICATRRPHAPVPPAFVRVGDVRRFDEAGAIKPQAIKVLEEASEAVEACKAFVEATLADRDDASDLLMRAEDEIADVVQPACNLAWSLGCGDLTAAMTRCETRNRERGRITDAPDL